MSQEDEILALFDKYFENATEEEIQKDVLLIDSLGKNGISYEQYLEELNESTSLILSAIGNAADDISFYNETIGPVQMGNFNEFEKLPSVLEVPSQFNNFNFTSENTYAMAA